MATVAKVIVELDEIIASSKTFDLEHNSTGPGSIEKKPKQHSFEQRCGDHDCDDRLNAKMLLQQLQCRFLSTALVVCLLCLTSVALQAWSIVNHAVHEPVLEDSIVGARPGAAPKLPKLTARSQRRLLQDDADETFEEYDAVKSDVDTAMHFFAGGVSTFMHDEESDSGIMSERVEVFSNTQLKPPSNGAEDMEFSLGVQLEGTSLMMEVLTACHNETGECSVIAPRSMEDARRLLQGGGEARRLVVLSGADEARRLAVLSGADGVEGRQLSAVGAASAVGWLGIGGMVIAIVVIGVAYGVSESQNRRRRGGCFAGGSLVETQEGKLAIEQVQIGKTLRTFQGFSPFVFQGHRQPLAVTLMVRLLTLSNHSVMVTPDHYFPLVSGGYSSAGALSAGNEIWVRQNGKFVPSQIAAVEKTYGQGLFNPYTTSGDIVVNDILASSHSQFFLENSGLTESAIVRTYNLLFSPLAIIHKVHPAAFSCFDKQVLNEQEAGLDQAPALTILWAVVRSLLGDAECTPLWGATRLIV